MSVAQKVVTAVVVLAVVVFGGTYVARDNQPPQPTREVTITTGTESTIDITTGETVRMNLDTLSYPQNQFSQYVTDYRQIDLTALADGTLSARLLKADGTEETKVLKASSLAPEQATDLHIWQEMNLLLVSSAAVRKTPTGMQVTYFRANRPELLPAAKAIEARAERREITETQARQQTIDLLANNGMLPTDAENRDLIIRMIQ